MINKNPLCNAKYISSGLFATKLEWIHPKRIIDSYEIILVLEGEVYIQQENEKYRLTKGDVFLLSPHKIHFGYQESSGKVSFYWLHFATDCIKSFGINSISHFEENYRLISLYKQLLHTANTPGYKPSSMDLYVTLILYELEFMQKRQNDTMSAFSKNLLEWIRINADKNITVMDVAENFGYNENYISKLFKKSFHIGMKEYINEEKMKLANNLLLSTNYSVKQIAFMLKYKEENLFIKFFKYHEGVSPTKFRNTYFNTHMNKK